MSDRLTRALTQAITEAPQHHRGALSTLQAAQARSPLLAVRVARFLQEAGGDLSPELVSELGACLAELHGAPPVQNLPKERNGRYYIETGLNRQQVDLLDDYRHRQGGISWSEALARLVGELEGR